MIDLFLLRESPEKITALIKKKEPSFDIEKLLQLDKEVRALKVEVESLRAQKNTLAQAAKGGVTPELRQKSIEISHLLKEKEQELTSVEKNFHTLYLECPNVPFDNLPEGGKENNKVVFSGGTPVAFDFKPKNHLELATKLGWLDFASAVQMTGSQFALYRGAGARLVYALTRLMIEHNQEHGFELIIPPFLVNEESLIVSSNFPKFRDQVYHIEKDHLYLTPTAEVNLVNMYRNAILTKEQLPARFTAWTSCFRREAGGYGATERGLIRIHQFDKVELVVFSKPEDAMAELDRMVACAKGLLDKLGLVYRISLLAGQDCSFASACTYDIEVFMPGQQTFMEVSSCSNCTDFQARRGSIRYREHSDDKPKLVHTLNASSLALPRLIVALLEQNQQEDGSVKIPDILKKYGA